MKLYFFFIPFFLFLSGNVTAQKIIKHKVKSGESIYAIAQKYDVTEKEIYDMNPKLKGAVLGLKTEVSIPDKKYKPEAIQSVGNTSDNEKVKPSTTTKKAKQGENILSSELLPSHLVLAKETLYSISKKYSISIDAITELNPEIKNGGLKAGMVLQLSGFDGSLPVTTENISKPAVQIDQKKSQPIIAEPNLALPNSKSDIIHKVQPKETLFRISKKYNVTIAELQQLNPSVISGLPVGYDLIIKKSDVADKETVAPVSSIAETVSEVVNVSALTIENLSKAELLIAKASENLGVHYRSGGTTPAGFDCSGLMYATFKNIDMTLPRSSHDMAKYGVKIDRSQAQKGDLIFFATFGRGRVSHVGMVTEVNEDEIKFIHSSTHTGVIISSTKEQYYSKTFVQVNRVLSQ